MSRPSFAFVPNDEVDEMVNQLPPPTTVPPPPPMPEPRTPEEITCRPPQPESESPSPAAANVDQPRRSSGRLRLETTEEQLQMLQELVTSGEEIPIAELCQRTRMTRATVYWNLKRLENGEDITKKRKRGRKPKHSPELLKKLSTDLCFKNKTLREEATALHNQNLEGIAQQALPVVSKSAIHRYVTDSALATENETEPLSFTQCTVRGPNSNSDQNKDLRIAKRTELDQYIRRGFSVVFVDESHWSVGNVRTRKWGEKGKKHFRTQPLTRFNLSCICAISDAGQKHCRLFSRTITGEIFKAYLTELMDNFSVQNNNVVFVMDNAPIHKEEIVQLAAEKNHAIIFNAPYSPECNPIELVFGFWKTRVGRLLNVDIADMITNIARFSKRSLPERSREV